MKIEIKDRWNGNVIFSHECENNTIKITAEWAIKQNADLSDADLRRANLSDADLRRANLSDANLSDADLRRANLSDANLSDANLSDANLRRADLSDANLSDADLSVFKDDLFIVLLRGIKEIPSLKNALNSGTINGSTYDGDCCCLSGTMANSCQISGRVMDKIMSVRDSSRPIERFFYRIKKGHTPENSSDVRLVLEWIEEFELFLA